MHIKYNVVIVGAGGTGSNLIARFSQFLVGTDADYEVIVIDGDSIEDKNLERQNFLPNDVLQNKADVICQAVSETYGLTFSSYSEYINTVNDLSELFNAMDHSEYRNGERRVVMPVLIGCCDNHRCRQVMEKWFDAATTAIYIDSANEFSVGEVVVGVKRDGVVVSPSRKFYFPEIMRSKVKRKSEESCGAINKSKPQHLATNCEAANILLSILCNLISNNSISGGIIYFDTFAFSKVFRPFLGGNADGAK